MKWPANSKEFKPFIHNADCTVCEGKPTENQDKDHCYQPAKQLSVADTLLTQQHTEKACREEKAHKDRIQADQPITLNVQSSDNESVEYAKKE